MAAQKKTASKPRGGAKQTRGKANPKVINKLLLADLASR